MPNTALVPSAAPHEAFLAAAAENVQKWQVQALEILKKLQAEAAKAQGVVAEWLQKATQKLMTQLEPHLKLLEPHLQKLQAAAAPHVAMARAKVVEWGETHGKALQQKGVELGTKAGDEGRKALALVRAKTGSWLATQGAESSKVLQEWQRAVSALMQRHLELSTQVWNGAVGAAAVAHSTNLKVHVLRHRLQHAASEIKLAAKAEDFDRAKLAKAAEIKLESLALEGEKLSVLKVEALAMEDYEAAAAHKAAFDRVLADSEAELQRCLPAKPVMRGGDAEKTSTVAAAAARGTPAGMSGAKAAPVNGQLFEPTPPPGPAPRKVNGPGQGVPPVPIEALIESATEVD